MIIAVQRLFRGLHVWNAEEENNGKALAKKHKKNGSVSDEHDDPCRLQERNSL